MVIQAIPESQATALQQQMLLEVLKEVLGSPTDGSVAYVRWLRTIDIHDLLEKNGSLNHWTLLGVSDEIKSAPYWVTTDQAVELRENREKAILLLIETSTAGAGMDGIYGAAREIPETEVLNKLREKATERLLHGTRGTCTEAIRQARRMTGRRGYNAGRELQFLVNCVMSPDEIGLHGAFLGLWPIAPSRQVDPALWAKAAGTTQRLLLDRNTSATTHARVDALFIPEAKKREAAALATFLSHNAHLPWRELCLAATQHADLWLQNLQPGFDGAQLDSIQIDPWRQANGKVFTWSGMSLPNSEEVPKYSIPAPGAVRPKKLEVRWKTRPQGLPKNSFQYRVSILRGENDPLVEKMVSHRGTTAYEKCTFGADDFEEYREDGGTWDVHIVVSPETHAFSPGEDGLDPLAPSTEQFVLTFQQDNGPETSSASSAKEFKCMADFAIHFEEEDLKAVSHSGCTLDRKGFITWRISNRSGKVLRPKLLSDLEEQWRQVDYAIGSWEVTLRDDGAVVGHPQFVPLDEKQEEVTRTKLWTITKRLGKKTEPRQGFLGWLHQADDADDYVNAWIAACEKTASPDIACANTVLVRDQLQVPRGLLVLPWHPLRVAWQQAYDRLALHTRFSSKIPLRRTQDLLKQLDSSYFPLFLPGATTGEVYVFGDVLGFHTVAMMRWDEKEPQAALALMTKSLYPKADEQSGLVGFNAARAIGREVARFSEVHPEIHSISLNSLRAGDGLTLTRALGHALTTKRAESDEETEEVASNLQGYVLNLHPSDVNGNQRISGRHLIETSQRRRAGVGAVPMQDRWMLESYTLNNVQLPRLQWWRRQESSPSFTGHLGVAFDTFESSPEPAKLGTAQQIRVLEAYGLFAPVFRRFCNKPLPTWRTALATSAEGLKHPAGKTLSDRLHELHSQLVRLSAIQYGGRDCEWLALKTEISGERADLLNRLHELHEWVLTVDRNAGLEYFDSPKTEPKVYDTYVIDCVPERDDLDSVRLVTSTSQLQELKHLLDDTLSEMGLSSSPRNCLELLRSLKAVSGRLAMRLASQGSPRQELIAVALLTESFRRAHSHDENSWLSLTNGFLVPLDDVKDLLEGLSLEDETTSRVRADLLHVEMAGRTGMVWTFIEVKYRRLLRSARERLVIQRMEMQTQQSSDAILQNYFSGGLHEVEKVVRRKRLVRALQFYADKASRHFLDEDAYSRITSELKKLLRPDKSDAQPEIQRRGYVFCPEHQGKVESLFTGTHLSAYLFGSVSVIPPFPATDPLKGIASKVAPAHDVQDASSSTEAVPHDQAAPAERSVSNVTGAEPMGDASSLASASYLEQHERSVKLGENVRTGEEALWTPTIKGNPHLMIVGLPGMGKTASIINLCHQLSGVGIRPIVFAYHDDIEERLASLLPAIEPVDIHAGLGFNPMAVVGKQPLAWVDHVGMLRDIFACIFPDFGDRQTNEIREALKRSYIEAGYTSPENQELTPPEFRRFFSIIKGGTKPNPGVVERLTELDDYGFFRAEGQAETLLQAGPPAIIRLHKTQNEVLQRATASFVLLHIYQTMFIRGEQSRLTHAVIFDEAHRASRLKLIATMAKECRKYGIALIVSSQAAKDFDAGLFSAIANYLTLRMTEADALALAKNVGASEDAKRLAGQLKKLEKYHALFFREGARETLVRLAAPSH